ncbi:hypothetical protein QFZ58_006644 [Streptomyces sp. B1I3]|nr:hypothetical protein [Streptomyces sp. B1I3]
MGGPAAHHGSRGVGPGTDALVARVDYSTGNLMLAGTDFDIAGVGQSLQLARTYNSLDAPAGAGARQRAYPGTTAIVERIMTNSGRALAMVSLVAALFVFTIPAQAATPSDAELLQPLGENAEGLSRIAFLDGNTAVMPGKVVGVDYK